MSFEYSKDKIRKMQLIELDMLKTLDDICRKNDISYEIDGGTLLGAIRHKGFIPWDDDVDVRMLRKDYDRFCEVCETQLDTNKYFLQTYKTDPEYRWQYARILRKGTFFDREHQEMIRMKRGIFIDIFPCDNMPSRHPQKEWFNFKCFFARKILYSVVGKKYEKNPIKHIFYCIISVIPPRTAHIIFEKLVDKYHDQDTALVRTLGWGAPEETRGFKRKWMIQRKEVLFEDALVWAPRDYDSHLKHMFGDNYMSPPPNEDQKPKHTAVEIDFGGIDL